MEAIYNAERQRYEYGSEVADQTGLNFDWVSGTWYSRVVAPVIPTATGSLTYNICEDRYIWTGNDAETPSNLGFFWNSDEENWYTSDLDKARCIPEEFQDEEAHASILVSLRRRKAEIADSFNAGIDAVLPVPAGLDYLPYQKAGILYGVKRNGVLIGDDMGLGKAQPLTSKLVTPDGYILMGDVSVGTMVMGSDGKATEVTGVYPQGERDVYNVIFTDGSEVECDGEHLWSVNSATRNMRGAKHKTLTLNEIRKDLCSPNGNLKHYVPLCGPVEFNKKALPIDPYLLGVLLGDGGFTTNSVKLSTSDGFILEQVEKYLPSGMWVSHQAAYDYILGYKKGTVNPLKTMLKTLGLWGSKSSQKFIPTEYLYSDVDDRVKLLQGLLDTDGYCNSKENSVQFNSSSMRLIEGVKHLVQSLGGVARFSSKEGSYNGVKCLDSLMLNIKLPVSVSPFLLERKGAGYNPQSKYKPSRGIKTVEYVGRKPVQCISVRAENSLYLTNEFVVTHNTIQGIGIVNYQLANRDKMRVIVICPASLKGNWKREMEKWLVKDLSVGIAQSSKPFPVTDVVIVNYDIVSNFKADLDAVAWDEIIIDESHYLKNLESKRTQMILGYTDEFTGEVVYAPIKAKHRTLLTGTPIPNRPKELFSLLNYLDPDTFPVYWNFVNEFCDAKVGTFGWDFDGASNLDKFQDLIRSTVMIRRLKKDVLKDLPAKIHQIIVLDADAETQAKLDAQMRFDSVDALKTSLINGSLNFSSKQAYDQKSDAMGEAEVMGFSEMAARAKEIAMLKLPSVLSYVQDILDNDPNHKIVLFGIHKEVIQAFEKYFGDRAVTISGSTPVHKRQGIVDAFQNDSSVQLFIGNIVAAGVGLTLTSASHVIFAELDWTPGNMQQAEDRCYRIGQKNAVLVQKFVFADSLDVKKIEMLEEKIAVQARALDI